MNLKEIRESGLLELYIIGTLDKEEIQIVEQAISDYPELKKDLLSISNSLEFYASIHSINPPPQVLNNILNEIQSSPSNSTDDSIKASSSSSFSIKKLAMPLIMAIGFITGIFYFNNLSNQNITIQRNLIACQEENQNKSVQIAYLEAINEPNNSIVSIEATPKYPNTHLYIHNNDVSKKNYLQIKNLPKITENQSFQLWSLKSNSDPIPLDVFESSTDNLIFEVQHIDDSNAYAITIEAKGGAQVPNLDDLIGVFNIKG